MRRANRDRRTKKATQDISEEDREAQLAAKIRRWNHNHERSKQRLQEEEKLKYEFKSPDTFARSIHEFFCAQDLESFNWMTVERAHQDYTLSLMDRNPDEQKAFFSVYVRYFLERFRNGAFHMDTEYGFVKLLRRVASKRTETEYRFLNQFCKQVILSAQLSDDIALMTRAADKAVRITLFILRGCNEWFPLTPSPMFFSVLPSTIQQSLKAWSDYVGESSLVLEGYGEVLVNINRRRYFIFVSAVNLAILNMFNSYSRAELPFQSIVDHLWLGEEMIREHLSHLCEGYDESSILMVHNESADTYTLNHQFANDNVIINLLPNNYDITPNPSLAVVQVSPQVLLRSSQCPFTFLSYYSFIHIN